MKKRLYFLCFYKKKIIILFKYLYISKNHRIMYGALINKQKVEGFFVFLYFFKVVSCMIPLKLHKTFEGKKIIHFQNI